MSAAITDPTPLDTFGIEGDSWPFSGSVTPGTLWERVRGEDRSPSVRIVWYVYDGWLPISAFDSYAEAREWINQAGRPSGYRILCARPEWLTA